MKKFIITGIIFLLTTSQCFAYTCFDKMCPQNPYDMTTKAGQIFYKITGSTLLAEAIGQSIIKKSLKKETKEKFKVKIDSYSAKDLIQGRFKSLEISGKDLNIDGVYISSLDINTLCNFNYVELNKNTKKFKENMVLHFGIGISNEDLQKTMNSTGYMDILNNVNLSLGGLTLFKIQDASTTIRNDKLNFGFKIYSPFTRTINVSIGSKIKVLNGEIVLDAVENSYSKVDMAKLTKILNMLNPLEFSLEILENKDTKMQVQDIKIIDNKILMSGNILIPKNVIKKVGAN